QQRNTELSGVMMAQRVCRALLLRPLNGVGSTFLIKRRSALMALFLPFLAHDGFAQTFPAKPIRQKIW
ncbi:MAG: hypothetical protein ACXWCS_08155, partial [Burkholderiales bacterium]